MTDRHRHRRTDGHRAIASTALAWRRAGENAGWLEVRQLQYFTNNSDGDDRGNGNDSGITNAQFIKIIY